MALKTEKRSLCLSAPTASPLVMQIVGRGCVDGGWSVAVTRITLIHMRIGWLDLGLRVSLTVLILVTEVQYIEIWDCFIWGSSVVLIMTSVKPDIRDEWSDRTALDSGEMLPAVGEAPARRRNRRDRTRQEPPANRPRTDGGNTGPGAGVPSGVGIRAEPTVAVPVVGEVNTTVAAAALVGVGGLFVGILLRLTTAARLSFAPPPAACTTRLARTPRRHAAGLRDGILRLAGVCCQGISTVPSLLRWCRRGGQRSQARDGPVPALR
jgi:hypothetical protein